MTTPESPAAEPTPGPSRRRRVGKYLAIALAGPLLLLALYFMPAESPRESSRFRHVRDTMVAVAVGLGAFEQGCEGCGHREFLRALRSGMSAWERPGAFMRKRPGCAAAAGWRRETPVRACPAAAAR